MSLKQLPNILTVGRVLLVPPFVWLLFAQDFQWALLLFFVAGLSDGVDGFLAKHYGWHSRFGAITDPLADKLLMVSAYTTLAFLSYLPFWLLFAVLARDIVIVAGATVYHSIIGPFIMTPSLLSKTNTFFQIFLVLLVLIELAYNVIAEVVIKAIIWLVFALTVSSGVHYVVAWSRKFLQERRRSAND
ncbi:MAG: CDP-alcohol phosphatidyltransferase family protein [Pseudomonadota bacterium]